MKKCPKCGAANKPDSHSCFNCYASLEGVAVTQEQVSRPVVRPQNQVPTVVPGIAEQPSVGQSRPVGVPLGDVPEEAETVVGQPLGGPQPYARAPQPSSPYGTPQGPPKMRYTEHEGGPELRRASPIWSILYSLLIVAIVFGGGGFAMWKYHFQPQGPMIGARKFIDAIAKNDAAGVTGSLTQGSLGIIKMSGQTPETMMSQFRGEGEQFEEGKQYKLKFVSIEGDTAKVKVLPGPAPALQFSADMFENGITLVLAKEESEGKPAWKVDLISTAAGLTSAARSGLSN